MTARRNGAPQLDLFVPALSDIQLRDQRDAMERPFFSLSKRKRMTPINYVSPDGSVTVVVQPHQGLRHADHLGRGPADLGGLDP